MGDGASCLSAARPAAFHKGEPNLSPREVYDRPAITSCSPVQVLVVALLFASPEYAGKAGGDIKFVDHGFLEFDTASFSTVTVPASVTSW